MSRLIVVSNRVTQAQEGTSRAGGLAVGMLAALKETQGLWFGWTGNIKEDPSPEPHRSTSGGVSYATVDLSPEDYEEYYRGFSNQTLWPLFHYRLDLTEFHSNHYHGYRRVNARFARQVKALARPDDLIWVQDYHLIPLAEELRKLGLRNRIGFFLHTPFPSHQVFIALPHHRELVRALSAYDVIGFQSAADLRTFGHYISFETNGEILPDGLIRLFRRVFYAGKFPIGVDAANIETMAAASCDSPQVRRLKESLRGRGLIIGVDRLDYSKGLIDRFRAYERLLELYPEHRARVVFMQVAPPSRGDVPQYEEIRHELETESGHINGRFAEFDWAPIRYLNRSFRRDSLAAFYRHACVGLVTPLRDGMNLVAKEYVAAQDPADPGVLVLSRFAGAAEQLTSALIVNPYDQDHVAATLARALDMPLKERQARWRTAMNVIRRHDITHWRQSFLRVLSKAPFSR